MDAKKPSSRSPTRSSPAPSKAGSAPAAATRPRASSSAPAGDAILARAERGDFPVSIYVEGPDEALKAAWLAALRHAWARSCPEAPAARVFRAGESGVDEILAGFQGSSLFTPRELLMVLEVEDLARSEKRVHALAQGIGRPAGASCLVLIESAADTPRKSLAPLRAACAARWTALPLGQEALVVWGRRRLEREGVTAEGGLVESVAEMCEGDPSAFFNELGKLVACADAEGRITPEMAAAVLRPAVGADLPDYLAAVAAGDSGLAARRLSRVLASGTSEGTVLFALGNLVGGALGGWSRHRDLSLALARRRKPGDLARALDAVYRAEAAWKRGRADAVAVLEQATRTTCGGAAAS